VKAAERRDEENLILYRGEQAYVLLNLYPYNSGHANGGAVPAYGDFAGLPNEVGTDVLALTSAPGALTSCYLPEGFK